MRNYLFVANVSLVAMLVFSALLTGLTYSNIENSESNEAVANDLEWSRFIDPASVGGLTLPTAYAKFGIVESAGGVNVTVLCYDINGDPLYLANVYILDPVGHYPIYFGFTNSSGAFDATNLDGGIVDVCVSWGNASAPGVPGYYMYLSDVDATSNVVVVVNAKDLRGGGGLAKIVLTVQNSTGHPMVDARLHMSFFGEAFPVVMGPITDHEGIVTLYLSNDTWAPDPTYYRLFVCQMAPSCNTFIGLDRLVLYDESVTMTLPSPSQLATINLTFLAPSGISLIRDIRLFFEFPQGPQGFIPPEINRDDLALMWLPSKLHGKMLFGVIGIALFPVTDDGTTTLYTNSPVLWIFTVYTNTTNVSGGPWVYTPVKVLDSLSPGDVEYVSMGGSYLKLRSVTPLETYLGSAPKLYVNFTDEYYNPLIWIMGEGSTSFSTGWPGVFSHLAIYNITIRYPDGDIWYDGQAAGPMDPWTLNGTLSGIPPFADLDRAGTYTYNISIDTGPWPLDPPGTPSNPLTGDFEVLRGQTIAFFNLNPNPAAVGQTVTLKGILVDESSTPLANEKVKLYARPLAGSWRYITSLTTNENGIFTWQAKIPVTGTFIFAVYYPGSEEFESTYNLAILIVQ